MKVAILGFLHESNTFLSTPTRYLDFERCSVTRRADMLKRWRGAHHELGGMIAGCEEAGLAVSPCMAALAIPGGTIEAKAYQQIACELIDSLQKALPVDGLLIALHGATVSAEFPDADGELLRRIRQVVGSELPIVATLDLHANISLEMVHNTTALICYRTNPHLDQEERGREAATLLGRTLRGEVRPVQRFAAPPMVIQISCQSTSEEPASLLYETVHETLRLPGILSASAAMGFYYADVAELGMSFIAIANGDAALAQRAADQMAYRAWNLRERFTRTLPSVATAVSTAIASTTKPVVLLDTGDNVGGGGPADSTILLHEILKQGASNALVVVYDPDAVRQCMEAGLCATVELSVGGKTDHIHGSPVRIRGRIRTFSDGHFTETEIRHGGWGGGDQGITAVIETEARHTIVLTSERMAPMSLEQIVSLGIHPERSDILIVKGVIAPLAAYNSVAGEFILVGTPGVTANDPAQFLYRHRRVPLYPLEPQASYPIPQMADWPENAISRTAHGRLDVVNLIQRKA